MIVPARPAKARDKAKVEVAVQVVERWILARLRHETFFSLAALNARIAALLVELNARPMRLYRASRRELFERLDQPALRPLPTEPFVYGEWKTARVNVVITYLPNPVDGTTMSGGGGDGQAQDDGRGGDEPPSRVGAR